MELRTCRFCSDQVDTRHLIKYATRSWAHHACYLKGKTLEEGLAWLDSLPSHELSRFPVFHFQDWYKERGGKPIKDLVAFFKKAIRAARRREISGCLKVKFTRKEIGVQFSGQKTLRIRGRVARILYDTVAEKIR